MIKLLIAFLFLAFGCLIIGSILDLFFDAKNLRQINNHKKLIEKNEVKENVSFWGKIFPKRKHNIY